ncbi:sulfatase family protein [Pontiella sulfatireligans]|uniref:Arylsulfatase n=1 Tax=Pontiella sulfatireligans TaxID=2750658 RepID=A0A6C2UFJ6_9BACT|nr:sulfatase-like hydrolase/transferase [Pontiella sulfatireligans]SPS74215.1 sulfatase S1_54 [Kiritimatiellales bacterium]VGO18653.1 Arylsulfatase [Pontiella sulfatireligans]
MKKRPLNVIWITTDHIRADAIGALGNPVVQTPNLDKLVNNGASFTNCFAQNPLCMPSRCSFMTGCYPQQTGVMENGQELPADFAPTMARSFANAGYRTLQIGKLHFQGHEDHDLDPSPRNTYGFDIFQAPEEPGCYEDAYRTWLRGEYPELVDTFTLPRPMSKERHSEYSEFQVLDAPWQASHSGWIATQACRYLGAWGLRQDPQFMHLGFDAPHPPMNPTREMFEPYRDQEMDLPLHHSNDWNDPNQWSADHLQEYRRHFYAMATGVDMAIGKLIDQLKELGVYEDTLILFNSDHGDLCGDHGRMGKGPSFYDSIMRVPWTMHWPNGLGTPGRRIDGLVEMIDVLPTLLDLTGTPLHPAMAGRSYARGLLDGSEVKCRDDVYAVHGPGHIMLRTEEYKYLRYVEENGHREVLYDLQADPGEFKNMANGLETLPARELKERALARTIEASRSILPRRLHF